MKKTIFVFVLIISVFLGTQAFGQASAPIDLVLLLDTSADMSSSYENVNNYITGAFLSDFLRVGDTFHLISFSANPRLDAARRISGIGDVETIVGRMFLQYPVERGTNIGAAITYAEQYIISLPSRPKKIVLVSTGGGSDISGLVTGAKQRLSSRNTTFDYIQVTPGRPLTNLPKSDRPAPVRTASPSSSGQTTRDTPPAPGQGTGTAATDTRRPQDTQPVRSTQPTQSAQSTQPVQPAQPIQSTETGRPKGGTGTPDPWSSSTGIQGDDKRDTGTSGRDDPWNTSTAQGTDRDTAASSGDTSVTSQTGRDSQSDRNTTGGFVSTYPQPERANDFNIDWSSNLPLIIGIILGILLLLGLILLLSSRRLSKGPSRVIEQASSRPSPYPDSKPEERFKDHSKDLNNYAAYSARRSTPYDDRYIKSAPVINPTGPLLLNLHVEDQSTSIGKRNIHSLKSGYGFSVGGGKSDDYLIFLVSMPANIGEIRRDGSTLTFTPKKAKYFPDIGSNPVRDCINKTIRIVSDKNYEMRFRFEMYEDPLVALNRMLMQVKVPGML